MKKAAAGLLFAYTALGQLTFDAASVKPNFSGDRSTVTRRGENSLVLTNWPLREIILKAYDLKVYALDAPDWTASLSFDINAKAGRKVSEAELRQMLQALLLERFQLKAHSAVKEMQAYALLPAKGGIKLKPVQDGAFDYDLTHGIHRTAMVCRHCSTDNLANVLSGQLDIPVVDQSSVPGAYSFTLEWSPNQNADDAVPSIFSAVSEQLGLGLEARKAPISILVIDSVSKTPVEN